MAWSVYAEKKGQPNFAQGYLSKTKPTEEELADYRAWFQMGEDWEVTVSETDVDLDDD
jgi:hypothetical protein